MAHRYDGLVTHRNGRHSWRCSCGANGATTYLGPNAAAADHEIHARYAYTNCGHCGIAVLEADTRLNLCQVCNGR